MINIFSFLKSKNKTFSDGDRIIYSGRGGISYIDNSGDAYNFGWLWDENLNLYKTRKVDLIFSQDELSKKILERLIAYCDTYNISYEVEK